MWLKLIQTLVNKVNMNGGKLLALVKKYNDRFNHVYKQHKKIKYDEILCLIL